MVPLPSPKVRKTLPAFWKAMEGLALRARTHSLHSDSVAQPLSTPASALLATHSQPPQIQSGGAFQVPALV